MKFLFVALLAICTAPSLKESAVLSFYNKSYAFPDTKEGVLLQHDFHFKNSGTSPLLITNYKVGCSCTKITFPNQPVMPGGKGKITVYFDTNHKYGYQNRVVEIFSNASKRPAKIRIKVNVIPKGYD